MSEWFENGILRVLVPSGWKLFYGIDSEGNASPRNLHIFKEAQTELDVFSKAGITVFYHGKDEIYICLIDSRTHRMGICGIFRIRRCR